jgi:DNA mismatch repair protein MutS
MSLIDDYFDYQIKYQEKYGLDTIVLMEVGSFYEVYGVDNDDEVIGKVHEVSSLLNIQLTKKNKSIAGSSRKNPLLCGIPSISIDKYLQILVNANKYTIVLVEQVTKPPNPKREVTKILSVGTNIDYKVSEKANHLASLYLEKHNDSLVVGISVIDVMSGEFIVYQVEDLKDDRQFAIQNLQRFISSYSIKEIIVTTNIHDYRSILEELPLKESIIHIHKQREQDLNYQNSLLNSIFNNSSFLSGIEYCNLEYHLYALYSTISLLEFILEHNKLLLKNISKPTIFKEDKLLKYHNQVTNQLQITSGESSLYNIINNCITSVGRRLLYARLVRGVIYDESILRDRYDRIELYSDHYSQIISYLKHIRDIERLHRRFILGILHPSEFNQLHNSYEAILNILSYLQDNGIIKVDESVLSITLSKFIEKYKLIFDVDKMASYNLNSIKESFIQKHYNREIDDLQYNIDYNVKLIANIHKSLFSICKLEYSDNLGYYFSTSRNRFTEIKDNFKSIEIEDHYFKFEDFEIKQNSNSVKIRHPYIIELSDKNRDSLLKLQELVQYYYLIELDELIDQKLFSDLVNFVSELDVSLNGVKLKNDYGYCKPNIDISSNESYIDVIGLRHPIIERINNDTLYIPNNLILGKTLDSNIESNNKNSRLTGMLVYGVNACGKSSLMKSVGLSIVLAQIGYYVPAKSFTYKPFKQLFVRISGDDDIYRGLSSFAREMIELRTILKHADKHSLVLGDEVSRGTETISGLSIVASTISLLTEKNVRFIFTTHLHKLAEIDEVKALSSVDHFHLKVTYDESNDSLIYDRVLEVGVGDTVYGLEVAKAMDMGDDFLKLANSIRVNLLESNDNSLIISKKKVSKYNSKKLKTNCMICNATSEEEHHINFQSYANEHNLIEHYHKNHKANLISLCEKCHQKVHKGDIVIEGFKYTSKGIILHWYYTT